MGNPWARHGGDVTTQVERQEGQESSGKPAGERMQQPVEDRCPSVEGEPVSGNPQPCCLPESCRGSPLVKSIQKAESRGLRAWHRKEESHGANRRCWHTGADSFLGAVNICAGFITSIPPPPGTCPLFHQGPQPSTLGLQMVHPQIQDNYTSLSKSSYCIPMASVIDLRSQRFGCGTLKEHLFPSDPRPGGCSIKLLAANLPPCASVSEANMEERTGPKEREREIQA